MYYNMPRSFLVGCSVFHSIKLTMNLGLATLLAQLLSDLKSSLTAALVASICHRKKKKKFYVMLTHSHLCPSSFSCSLALSSTFTHSTSLSLLLVCTHSNCVSSHLVTLSSTLPSLLVSLTHAHACTHTDTKKHISPQQCWILFDQICDLCTSLVKSLIKSMYQKLIVCVCCLLLSRSFWSSLLRRMISLT